MAAMGLEVRELEQEEERLLDLGRKSYAQLSNSWGGPTFPGSQLQHPEGVHLCVP